MSDLLGNNADISLVIEICAFANSSANLIKSFKLTFLTSATFFFMTASPEIKIVVSDNRE